MIKEILISNNKNFFIKNFSTTWTDLLQVTLKNKVIQMLPKLIIETFIISSIIFFIYFNLGKDFKNYVPILSVYMIALIRIYPSINAIYLSVHTLRYFKKPFINMYEHTVLNKHEMNKSTTLNVDKELIFKDSIVCENLSFFYENDRYIFKNLNFEIKKNRITCIKGKSGSGKTTLLHLLMSLLRVNEGQIFIDGKNLNEIISEYRNIISYVPQEVQINDDTIKNNITLLSRKNEDMQNFYQAIKKSQIEEFINSLPSKENTFCGETGTSLSGGQRQRIGIARAIYVNPKIIFLDEFTSALDSKTEIQILETLKKIKNEITIIICSHNNNVIENSDDIIEL